jgi:hypothetical protein
MTMDVFEDRDIYEVEIVRVEYRTYKMRIRAYDREDAAETAIREYDPSKPSSVEVVEEYAEQIDWVGP